MSAAGRETLPTRTGTGARLARGRQRLPLHAFRAGEAACAVLPPRLAHGIAAALATGVVVARPRRFDGLRANLRQATGESDRRRLERLTRRGVRNIARSWVEVLSMRSRSADLDRRVITHGTESILAALERGRGVMGVSMHFGAWEAGLASWNLRGNRMSLLAEQLEPPELFERICGGRGRMGVKVIPIDVRTMRSADAGTARRLGAAVAREIYRVLRTNGVITVALDRDLVGNGTAVEFFGRPAPIPMSMIDIAMRTGAAIVPIVLVRDGQSVNGNVGAEIAYDAGATPREAEVRRVTGVILRQFEAAIRANPEQWAVMDPIWSAA